MLRHSKWHFLVLFLGIFACGAFAKCSMKNSDKSASRNPYLCTNQFMELGRKMADPENCQCYYHCSYNQEPCYMCCAYGYVYNPDQERCLPRNSYHCISQMAKFKCPGHGLYGNPDHCRKYWDCRNVKRTPVEEACKEQHHWDDRQKICRKDVEVAGFERDIQPRCVRK